MKISFKKLIIVIAIIGILLRIVYVGYTSKYDRQHDVPGNTAHLGYINTIYETNELPKSNSWQFYHPPLHHIVASQWIKVVESFGIEHNEAEEKIQILTLVYSCLIIVITYLILKEIDIEDKFKFLIMSVISMHPTLIILSGSINNDILMIMFLFLDMLLMIKWFKKPSILRIILLALSVALGALTKISSTIVAIPIMYIFIVRFIKDIKEAESKKKCVIKYVVAFAIFGIIALGLGLSYSIRNKVLFNQDLFYVPSGGPDTYCGDRDIWDRITPFSSEWQTIFCHPFDDCNVFAFLIKCSVFGEYYLPTKDVSNLTIETAIIILNIVIILMTLIGFVDIIVDKVVKKIKHVKNTDDDNIMNMFIVFYLTQMILYFVSVFKMPYGCTMDFRYIVPTLLFGMLFLTRNSLVRNKKICIFVFCIIELFVILSAIFTLTDMKFLVLLRP